jgi:hypothetical protein
MGRKLVFVSLSRHKRRLWTTATLQHRFFRLVRDLKALGPRALVLLSCLATLPCIAAPALAADDEPVPAAGGDAAREAADEAVWNRRYSFAILGDLVSGVFSLPPYGMVGASFGYAPAAWLSIDSGVGIGVFSHGAGGGAQWVLMPRARLIFGRDAIALGTGVSVGPYEWNEIPYDSGGDIKDWAYAWRLNVEVSYEHRTPSGLTLRPYIGIASLLNRGDGVCSDRAPTGCPSRHADQPAIPLPYAGFAIGYAF